MTDISSWDISLADFLDKSRGLWTGRPLDASGKQSRRWTTSLWSITGAALGLPGTERVFDDANIERILGGEQFIGASPHASATRCSTSTSPAWSRATMAPAASTRSTAPTRSSIWLPARAVRSRRGIRHRCRPRARARRRTRLAIGAGLDALRDAGIPLVLRYKTTTWGRSCPSGGGCPTHSETTPGSSSHRPFPGSANSPTTSRLRSPTATGAKSSPPLEDPGASRRQ